MNSQTQHPAALPTLSWPGLDQLRNLQPHWYYAGLVNFGVMVFCLLAMTVDDRTLQGVSVWAKPMKFGLSIGVYYLTLVWFSQYLRPGTLSTRAGHWLVGIPLVAGMAEISYILVMAALGQASHYNFSSSFTITMYSLMGVGAVSMVAVLPWMAYLIGRYQPLHHPLIFAIVVGLVLTCVLGGGYGMYLSGNDNHWVEATRTDANGLWLFNWARDGGDLRVAHFFGMHALHAFPLFALALNRVLPDGTRSHTQLAILIGFICAYTAFSAITFTQALQGQPFMG
ncbi:MAG: hypothetical protein RJQ07_14990 [Pseudomonadales bacterium]